MKKSNKQLIFERMGLGFDSTNEDEFADRAGQGQGMVGNLIDTIEDSMFRLVSLSKNHPEIASDVNNIINRLSLNVDRAKEFVGEGKEHKRKGNIRGMWGVDDDGDGMVDGSSGGGFGGDGGGGGESYTPSLKEGTEYREEYKSPSGYKMQVFYESTYGDYTLLFPQLSHPDGDNEIRLDGNEGNARKAFEFAKEKMERAGAINNNTLVPIYDETDEYVRSLLGNRW